MYNQSPNAEQQNIKAMNSGGLIFKKRTFEQRLSLQSVDDFFRSFFLLCRMIYCKYTFTYCLLLLPYSSLLVFGRNNIETKVLHITAWHA